MNGDDDINQFVPSVLNPRAVRKNGCDSTFLTQNTIVSRCSLSLKKNGVKPRKWVPPVQVNEKENSQNQLNTFPTPPAPTKQISAKQTSLAKTLSNNVADSLGFSAVEDLSGIVEDIGRNNLLAVESCNNPDSDPFSFSGHFKEQNNEGSQNEIKDDKSVLALFSATDLNEAVLDNSSDSTIIICENDEEDKNLASICEVDLDRPSVSLSFGFMHCENVNIVTNRVNVPPVQVNEKENSQNQLNTFPTPPAPAKQISAKQTSLAKTVSNNVADSLGFSAVEDLSGIVEDIGRNNLLSVESCKNPDSDPFSFSGHFKEQNNEGSQNEIKDDKSLLALSSATELNEAVLDNSSDSTIIICENDEEDKNLASICEVDLDRSLVSLSFGFMHCENVNIVTNRVNVKNISFTHKNNNVLIDCDIIESSQISTNSIMDNTMTEEKGDTLKRSAVTVNLEIKKKKLSTSREDATEDTKLLILNTNAIEKVTHVIVQPPNYKLVKRKLSVSAKSVTKSVSRTSRKNAYINAGDTLKQTPITAFFKKTDAQFVVSETDSKTNWLQCNNVTRDEAQEMNKNLSVYGTLKSDHVVRSYNKNSRNELNLSPRSTKLPLKHEASPKRQTSSSEAHSACLQMTRNNSGSSYSPAKKTGDSAHASASTKSKSKGAVPARSIPHHKIVAGTHFAVDAFSYGEIPNVKNYFLTHFHSDHYSGLKKTFSKTLFCSKITADLCMTRLGVNPKCIHVMKLDECIRVEGVEVVAVDANHCPGAVMLVFTLPNGRTILHTGDFRASPIMESYPIFWNKDIYSIYLDTTYCNPRYDFPTQDQSLDMALYLLRQKKIALEKVGKKFSSVLIVCGTYTIGKEKFFLGMARRVGCSVWACPEKDRVLQAVEGRSFSHAPSNSCQLHVVPMRDLTYDKLRSYLESLQGAFSEVVAFKPSGWENGKNSTVERDHVTIYGIPYSEHSSFSEMIRFVKFIKPKKVVPTVDISGGIKAVQKYFPCPLVYKEDVPLQSRMTDFSFSIHPRQQVAAVT